MMYLNNKDDIVKIIRKYIHDVIGINLKDIVNGTDVYGPDLLKLLEGKKYNSYKLNDSVIVLDLETRENTSDMSITKDDSIIYYKSYELKLIIYGRNSVNLGNQIFAEFNSDYVLTDLITNGIYIQDISNPHSINEFVNGVMWPRCDLNINVMITHKYDLLKYEMTKANDINIVKNE